MEALKDVVSLVEQERVEHCRYIVTNSGTGELDLAGENHHRQTSMAIYFEFHITVQVMGIFFIIICMHIA